VCSSWDDAIGMTTWKKGRWATVRSSWPGARCQSQTSKTSNAHPELTAQPRTHIILPTHRCTSHPLRLPGSSQEQVNLLPLRPPPSLPSSQPMPASASATAAVARSQLQATIVKSGLLKTNAGVVPRPSPSLFYFPGIMSKPVHAASTFHWARVYVYVWRGQENGKGGARV